jgi:hypothetical protein
MVTRWNTKAAISRLHFRHSLLKRQSNAYAFKPTSEGKVNILLIRVFKKGI